MPSAEQHFKQYQRNRNTLDRIMTMAKPPYDWAVTIAFYAAVHLIENTIVQKSGDSTSNHDQRLLYVNKLSELKPIRSYYKVLLDNGWRSRYMCVHYDEKQVKQIVKHLTEIENQLLN